MVEQVLGSDPYFQKKMTGLKPKAFVNRRGVKRSYSPMTVELVGKLATEGLDAVAMRREAVIAKAVETFSPQESLVV